MARINGLKDYDRSDWGISRTEYNRLRDAVEQGILPYFTVEGRRYELKNGLITADELIRGFDSRNRFISNYSANRVCIGQDEFEVIASSVLESKTDVYSYKFFNMAVEITLNSRSHKTKWNTLLDFDDNGTITGKYTYTQAFPGASQPWVIGNEISRRIKSALYD
jgi:hypothetical protein